VVSRTRSPGPTPSRAALRPALFKDAPDLIAATRPGSFPDSFRVTLKAPSGFCDVARLKNQPGVSQITGPAAYTASC
jgi:hypothetical protein